MIRHPTTLLAAAALAALLLWAPMPFGSVTYVARTALELGCVIAFVVAVVVAGDGPLGNGVRLPAVALLAIAGWGWLQSVALPVALVHVVSPRAESLRIAAAELMGSSAPSAMPLSLAPDLSRRMALWWASLALALFAAGAVARRPVARRLIAGSLLAAALFEILYGSQRGSTGGALIWGVAVPGGGSRLRGTFVNPDHLALYLELALVIVFAWLWWGARRARNAVTLERRLMLVGPPLLVWLGLFAAIAFTGSRAGLVAALAATAAQGAAAALRRRRFRVATVGVGLGLLGIATVAALGLQEGLGRWLATSPYELTWNSRRVAYAAAWELWQRFPWSGTGMASFRETFPMVQPASLTGRWAHAHSDWLEALVTLGIPGAILILVALAATVTRLFRVLAGDNRSEDRAAALAGYGALAAAAVHSGLDFGLTMPATALSLVVLVGVTAGAPVVVTREEQERKRKRRHTPRATAVGLPPARVDGPTELVPHEPVEP
jgi:O-antigen ligase